MKHKCNSQYPSLDLFSIELNNGQSKQEQFENYLDWWHSHIIGEPVGTDVNTYEQLKKAGVVGLYK